MSANFWLSSQCKNWLLDVDQKFLDGANAKDQKRFEAKELQHLHNYFLFFLQQVGSLLRLRQRAVATAFVYFKRTYLKFSFCEIHPILAVGVSILLATKVEECEVRAHYIIEALAKACLQSSNRCMHSETKLLSMSHMIECELLMLQALDLDLIVYHPYRYLSQYAKALQAPQQSVDIAWKVINDSFRTTLCFRFPPHLISLGALCVSCGYLQHDFSKWLSTIDINRSELKDVVHALGSFYDSQLRDQNPPPIERLLKQLLKTTPPLESSERLRQHGARHSPPVLRQGRPPTDQLPQAGWRPLHAPLV